MFYARKMQCAALAAAAVFCVAGSAKLDAATAGKEVVYHVANGVFATPAISGNDLFGLAGNTFQLSMIVPEKTAPAKHGKQWAIYQNLTMKGLVNAGNPAVQYKVHSNHAVLFLSKANAAYDEYKLSFDYEIAKEKILWVADIQMPKGTLAGFLIKPFNNTVTLTAPPSGNITVTYSNSTASTVLGATGSFSGCNAADEASCAAGK